MDIFGGRRALCSQPQGPRAPCLESGFDAPGKKGPWEIFKQESDMMRS